MILFLSDAFLKRLRLVFKTDLKAFLVGDRNLFFYTPDTAVPVQDLNPETIDRFLKNEGSGYELLGFITNDEIAAHAGHIHVWTQGSEDPNKWKAWVFLYEDAAIKKVPLEIRTAS